MANTGEVRASYADAVGIAAGLSNTLRDERERVETAATRLEGPARDFLAGILPQLVRQTGFEHVLEAAQKAYRDASDAHARWDADGKARQQSILNYRIEQSERFVAEGLRDSTRFSGSTPEAVSLFQSALERPAPTTMVGRMRDPESVEAHRIVEANPRLAEAMSRLVADRTELASAPQNYNIASEPVAPAAAASAAAMATALSLTANPEGMDLLSRACSPLVSGSAVDDLDAGLRGAGIAQTLRSAASAAFVPAETAARSLGDRARNGMAATALWPDNIPTNLDPSLAVRAAQGAQRVVGTAVSSMRSLVAFTEDGIARQLVNRGSASGRQGLSIGDEFLLEAARSSPASAYAVGAATAVRDDVGRRITMELTAEGETALIRGRDSWWSTFPAQAPSAPPPQQSPAMSFGR